MENKKQNKVGRPTTPLDLPKGWQDDVLHLYSEGGSDVEIKAMIWRWRKRFSNDLWDRWMRDEPEFSETIKMGRMLAECWWNENGRTNLKDRDFNYTGWYMQMKNRYGWADKSEQKSEVTVKDFDITKVVNFKNDNS